MKKTAKFISVCLTLIMLFVLFPINAFQVNAAEAGTLPSNAIELKNNVWNTKYWTNSNYDLNCYNKIVISKRGYITFSATKPFDDEGEICSYDLTLYDGNGDVVWAADTGDQENSFSEYYTYKIGLDAGIYYMNIDPNFYVYRSSAPIETKHKYTFTKSSSWEIENNNNQTKATQISLDKTYYGVYADESYDIVYKDYYKIKLTKGTTYYMTIGNYSELDAGTTILEVVDPKSNDILPYSYTEIGNAARWEFVPSYSGWHYIVFDNDGNDAGTEYTLRVTAKKQSIKSLKISLARTSYTYDGTAKKPRVIVETVDGKTLEKGTDYTVTYASGRKNVGTYKVTVKMIGNYTGTKVLTFKIAPVKVAKCTVKLSATSYTYNGKAKTPTVTVKDSAGKTLKKGTDYTVSYASGRKNVGTYKVTIKFKGNYSGTKTLTFKIVPKAASISKLTAKSKAIAVKLNRVTTQSTGYQIQYSTSSKFTSAKTVNVTSYKTSSKTISGLKKGKKYYVRVRTYKTVGGTKIYSTWSASKSVKTK